MYRQRNRERLLLAQRVCGCSLCIYRPPEVGLLDRHPNNRSSSPLCGSVLPNNYRYSSRSQFRCWGPGPDMAALWLTYSFSFAARQSFENARFCYGLIIKLWDAMRMGSNQICRRGRRGRSKYVLAVGLRLAQCAKPLKSSHSDDITPARIYYEYDIRLP